MVAKGCFFLPDFLQGFLYLRLNPYSMRKRIFVALLILLILSFGISQAQSVKGQLVRDYVTQVYQLILNHTLYPVSYLQVMESAWKETKQSILIELPQPQNWNDFLTNLAQLDDIFPEETSRFGELAIRGMLKALPDPYCGLMNPTQRDSWDKERSGGGFPGLGIELAIKEGKLEVAGTVPQSPASRAGIRSGDQLLAINQMSLEGIAFTQVLQMLEGPINQTVGLKLKRGDEVMQTTLRREEIRLLPPQPKLYRVNGRLYGYIKINYFSSHTPGEVESALAILKTKNIQGLILDLRNNPGGDFNAGLVIASFFQTEKPVVLVEEKGGRKIPYYTDKPPLYRGKIAVLINSATASAAELLALALQSNHLAELVGEHSYGKNLIQSTYSLTNHYALYLTTNRFWGVDNQDIGGVGLTPDIPADTQGDEKTLLKIAIKGME